MGQCSFIREASQIPSPSQRLWINTVWHMAAPVRINSWCTCQGDRPDLSNSAIVNNFVGQIQNYDYLIVGAPLS